MFEHPKVKAKYSINRFSLIIGSLFPDLIDKPLLILGLASGRGYSHTLIFIFCAFIMLHLISRFNYAISLPFLIGEGFHLLLDIPYVPFFYPFVQYDFEIIEYPIGLWWNTLLTNPLVISTELIGLGILLFILINNKLYNLNDIIEYLKTNPKGENNNKNSHNNIITK